MNKQKAYSTHEIAEAKNASHYFLRGIGMAFYGDTLFYFLLRRNLHLNFNAPDYLLQVLS
jgi:hypothetical protein